MSDTAGTNNSVLSQVEITLLCRMYNRTRIEANRPGAQYDTMLWIMLTTGPTEVYLDEFPENKYMCVWSTVLQEPICIMRGLR